MSSGAGLVVQYIEQSIAESIPGVRRSPFTYSPEKNNENDLFVYAVRTGPLNAQNQVNRTMNVTQSFEIELIRSFKEVGNGDAELVTSIESLYSDHEKLFQKLSLRNSTEFRILNISDFSSSGPEIDRTKKTASLTYTYRIHYRKEIKEG